MESLAKSIDALDGHHLEAPITKTLSDSKKYMSQPWTEFSEFKFYNTLTWTDKVQGLV